MSALLPLYIDLEAVPSPLRREQTTGDGFGVAGVRDPDLPCDAFAPGTPDAGNRCDGDGHYLCWECSELRLCDGGCGQRPMCCACLDPENEVRP